MPLFIDGAGKTRLLNIPKPYPPFFLILRVDPLNGKPALSPHCLPAEFRRSSGGRLQDDAIYECPDEVF